METQTQNKRTDGSYRIVCRKWEEYGDYSKAHFTKGPIETVEEKGLAQKVAEAKCARLNKELGGNRKDTKDFFVHGNLEGTIYRNYRVEYDPTTQITHVEKVPYRRKTQIKFRSFYEDLDFLESIGHWPEPVRTSGCYWNPKMWP
ncbi:MAG: hypothetical protein PHH54_01165 [Candidatus Nanoarchaeia archaeon]|nr:hypothetical protein [Candidatus Nanoarchaeia archaeon]